MPCSRLGTPGQLAEIYVSVGMASDIDASTQTITTIGGLRYARIPRGRHRTWQIPAKNCRPSDLVNLEAFASGSFGHGPFWWIDSYAALSNLLPPRFVELRTDWTRSVNAGPLTAEETLFPRSIAIESGISYLLNEAGQAPQIPVVPGVPVTFSMHLSTPGMSVMLFWRDADGVTIGAAPYKAAVAAFERVAVTGLPPDGAVAVQIAVSGSGRAAGPAVTWTSKLMPFAPGAGSDAVVVHGGAVEPVVVGDGSIPLRVTAAYQVTEVGS